MSECPYCEKDISDKLENDFNSDPVSYHEFECPFCWNLIDVEVEAIPHFILTKKGD